MDTKFYVARTYNSETTTPTIVETFDNDTDAREYAALMSRAKRRNYVVLKQASEWIGDK